MVPRPLYCSSKATPIQFLHDLDQIEVRRQERELHVFAQRYAAYAATTSDPQPFSQFVAVLRSMHG